MNYQQNQGFIQTVDSLQSIETPSMILIKLIFNEKYAK